MLVHPQFDPVALALGPIQIRWYGLMYLVAFLLFWLLGRLRVRDSWRGMTQTDVEDLLFYGVFGVVVGGRLGFCLFYQPDWFLSHPLDIFKVWQGGMSAHGGLIGVIVTILWYGRTHGKHFFDIADFVAPLSALGLCVGRIGNFINGELWGRLADPSLPWAMVFPQSGSLAPRHPSQLYEAGLEGLALFILLWWWSSRPRPRATTSALFCLGYAAARFTVEFFREPDVYLGFGYLGLTRGQWLTVPLAVLGAVLLFWAGKRKA